MDSSSNRYYQNKGTVPAGGVLLPLAMGLPAALVLGSLYACVSAVMGGLVGFFAFCFAVPVIGNATRIGLRHGQLRNRYVMHGIIIAVTVATLYAAWVAYLYCVSGDITGSNILILNPIHILKLIGRVGNELGYPYIVCILEAVLCYVVIAGVASIKTENPYCSRCKRWAVSRNCKSKLLVPADLEQLKQSVEEGKYSELRRLLVGIPDPGNHLRIEIWNCPKCDQSTWLSVISIINSLGRNCVIEKLRDEWGRFKRAAPINYNAVIDLLEIPRPVADRLVSLKPPQWYYRVREKEVGPITRDQLKKLADTEQITPETQVRLETSEKWLRAERVRNLFLYPSYVSDLEELEKNELVIFRYLKTAWGELALGFGCLFSLAWLVCAFTGFLYDWAFSWWALVALSASMLIGAVIGKVFTVQQIRYVMDGIDGVLDGIDGILDRLGGEKNSLIKQLEKQRDIKSLQELEEADDFYLSLDELQRKYGFTRGKYLHQKFQEQPT